MEIFFRVSEITQWSWTPWEHLRAWGCWPTTTAWSTPTTPTMPSTTTTACRWTAPVLQRGSWTWGTWIWTRQNLSVETWRWSYETNTNVCQNDGTVESIRILDDAIWLKMMIPQVLMMTPQVLMMMMMMMMMMQVFLVCLYCLVCLSGLVTNLSLIWVRNKMPRTSHKIVASIADKCQQQCQVILGKKVHRTPKNLYILNLGISGLSTRWGFLESIFSKKRF